MPKQLEEIKTGKDRLRHRQKVARSKKGKRGDREKDVKRDTHRGKEGREEGESEDRERKTQR